MKIDGHEVVICCDCAFPDGEPIMHVMAPIGRPCAEVMTEMREQHDFRTSVLEIATGEAESE